MSGIDLIDVDRKSAPCILAPRDARAALTLVTGAVNAYGAPPQASPEQPRFGGDALRIQKAPSVAGPVRLFLPPMMPPVCR